MLEEVKELYIECADMHIPEWRKLSKNQLAFLAVEKRYTQYYDGYVSALMLKYWGKMTAYYHKCKLVITPEDAHAWLVNAIMYALDKHPWTNPKSSIYQDKNGPDKVINRVIESRRKTFYQQLNRYNRKINSLTLSLESLTESTSDIHTPMCEDEHTFIMDDLIIRAFKEKDYFFAFLVDAIITEGYKVGGRNKKLVTHLKHLESHCDIFAGRYDLNLESVIRASTYITRLSRTTIAYKINVTLNDIKKKLAQDKLYTSDTTTSIKLHNPNSVVEYYYVNLWD